MCIRNAKLKGPEPVHMRASCSHEGHIALMASDIHIYFNPILGQPARAATQCVVANLLIAALLVVLTDAKSLRVVTSSFIAQRDVGICMPTTVLPVGLLKGY